MKNWVRPGRSLFVAGLASGCLVASAAATTHHAKSTSLSGTITVADLSSSGNNLSPLQAEANAFMKKYPKIHVKMEEIPDANYNAVVKTALQGGGGPDLYRSSAGTGDNAAAQTFGRAGLAANLAGQPWVSKIPPNAAGYYVGKKLYGLPMDFTTYAYIYNVADLQKWGVKPPTSLTQALAYCAAAKSHGGVAFAIAGAVPANTGVYAMLLAQADVYAKQPNWDTLRAHGKVRFATTKGWVQALNDFIKMNNAGCFEPGASGAGFDQLTTLLGSQQAGAVGSPTFSIPTIESAAHLTLNTFGAFGSAGYGGVLGNFGNGVSLNPHSKHVALDDAFLAFLAGGVGQHVFATVDDAPSFNQIKNGTIPAGLGLSGVAKSLKTQAEAGTISWPPASWNQATYAALGQGVQGLLTGQTTVSAVLKSMDQAWTNNGV
jgi:raffinose/stachyose/melibiose transport system substrate-binding protein